MSEIALLQNISKTYQAAPGAPVQEVKSAVDLRIGAGETIAITGPSGCGKSTLLHILGMLDEPTAGEYWFLGEAVHKFNERRRTELDRD